jgi:uncharacterized membrane protein YjfL (UPF0719 family)
MSSLAAMDTVGAPDGWHWAAAVELLLLLVLLLQRYDTLRDRAGRTMSQATRSAGKLAATIPIAVGVMALAS